jgi:hypothetical protein
LLAILSCTFLRRATYSYPYLTFRDVSPIETKRWHAALFAFVQKLTYKYHKPIVLKSPGHTARIKLLLEIFPLARFVPIHRHPITVHQPDFQAGFSTCRAYASVLSRLSTHCPIYHTVVRTTFPRISGRIAKRLQVIEKACFGGFLAAPRNQPSSKRVSRFEKPQHTVAKRLGAFKSPLVPRKRKQPSEKLAAAG